MNLLKSGCVGSAELGTTIRAKLETAALKQLGVNVDVFEGIKNEELMRHCFIEVVEYAERFQYPDVPNWVLFRNETRVAMGLMHVCDHCEEEIGINGILHSIVQDLDFRPTHMIILMNIYSVIADSNQDPERVDKVKQMLSEKPSLEQLFKEGHPMVQESFLVHATSMFASVSGTMAYRYSDVDGWEFDTMNISVWDEDAIKDKGHVQITNVPLDFNKILNG